MFPFWTAQKLDSASRGYYVDQTRYNWIIYHRMVFNGNFTVATGKSNYEIVLNYNTNAVQFRYGTLPNGADTSIQQQGYWSNRRSIHKRLFLGGQSQVPQEAVREPTKLIYFKIHIMAKMGMRVTTLLPEMEA